MPQVKFSPNALQDLVRLREFLKSKNAAAARRAAQAIIGAVKTLEMQPHVGRPASEMEIEFRELVIDFGDSGYIALYHYAGKQVTVLAIRHQKEAGY